MDRPELGALLRLLVNSGRLSAEQAAGLVRRFDLGLLATADLPVSLAELPTRLTTEELAVAMADVAVRLTPKQAAPFLASATKPVTKATPPEVKQFLRERLRDHFRYDYEKRVAKVTSAMANGGDIGVWHKTMAREQHAYVARMMTSGVGRPLAPTEVDTLNGLMKIQQGFLQRFVADVAARRLLGIPHSEAYLINRALQYGGVGWEMWHRGNEAAQTLGKDGYIVYYIAVDDGRTCGPCLDAMNGSPYQAGTDYPRPGQVCAAHGRCRCHLRIVYDEKKWAALATPPTPKKPYDLSDGTRIREEFLAYMESRKQERFETQIKIEDISNEIDGLIHNQKIEMISAPDGWSDEVYERYKGQIKALQAQRQLLYEKDERLNRPFNKVIADIMKVDPADAIKLDLKMVDFTRTKEMKEKVADVKDWMETFVHNNGNSLAVEVHRDKSGRAYALPGSVYLGKEETRGVIAHEFVHNVEYGRGAEARAKRIAFYEDRTAGDPVEKLADAHPGWGYKDHEIFKRDKWMDNYIGKIYAHDNDNRASSEMITMGVQYLWEKPLDFAEKDPEFFDFTVAYVRNTL